MGEIKRVNYSEPKSQAGSQSSTSSTRKNHKRIKVFGVILVILFFAAGLYYLGSRQESVLKPDQAVEVLGEEKVITLIGKVVAIGQDQLAIKVEPKENDDIEETSIVKVLVTENTEYKKMSGFSTNQVVEPEIKSKANLRVGNKVVLRVLSTAKGEVLQADTVLIIED